MRTIAAVALLVACAALPASALAAPPPNDQRAAAQPLVLPAGVNGTTRDSTLDEDEPGSCAQLKGSVWYAFQPAAGRRVVARLAASGDLDAVVDVFQRTRSQLTPVGCDVGNSKGRAEVTFRSSKKPASYLVRVGQRSNSVPGGFRLDVFVPQPPPKPPGPQLPAAGVTRTVNITTNASDAFSTVMHAGTTYRIHRAQSSGCTSLELFAPGTTDFEDDSPVKTAGCGGYFLFTPGAGEGGRYSLLVTSQPRRRGDQRYHLQVARASADDTSPGLPLANYQRAHGALQGSGVDVVDLYRFSLAQRSRLRLSVSGGFRMQLLRDTGSHLGSSDDGEIDRRVSKGRYFVAVRALGTASGRYVLQRAARAVTKAGISIDGGKSVQAPPGRAVRIAVRLRPAVAGPVRITIERFDPFASWQFHRRVTVQASGGLATLAFTPPSEGRWRASAEYRGTRLAAPSETGFARVLVASAPG